MKKIPLKNDPNATPKLEYCIMGPINGHRINRINFIDPNSVRKHLQKHPGTTYSIWFRRRDPNGRRGIAMRGDDNIRGVNAFEKMLLSKDFKSASSGLMTLTTYPSNCEIAKPTPTRKITCRMKKLSRQRAMR